MVSTDGQPDVMGMAVLLCKEKRKYLLTCKVSRYCLLALHGTRVSCSTYNNGRTFMRIPYNFKSHTTTKAE